MVRYKSLLPLPLMVGALSAGCVSVPTVVHAPAPTHRDGASSPTLVVSVALSPDNVALIHAYYTRDDGHGKGHGKAKGHGRDGLPPGIAMNLARGKPLPPGIAKQQLPRELLVALPRPQHGLEYLVVAGKLLLVEATTQVIHDVLLESVFG